MASTNISKAISIAGCRATLLAILFWSLPLFGEGGIQDVPPWPNQYGPNIVTNGDMESMAGWNLSTCGAQDSGTGIGSSASLAVTGNCTITTTFTSPDSGIYPWLEIRMWVRRDAASDGQLTFNLRDGTPLAAAAVAFETNLGFTSTGRLTDQIVQPAGDYLEVVRIFAVGPYHGSESNWKLEIVATNRSAGTIYVDNVELRGANYPLYSFVKYPVYKGYLWSGHDSWLCDGSDAEEACGFVDVRPPSGTLAEHYVEVHRDTSAGCLTPDATVTIQPTVQRTDWEMDLSSVAEDAEIYICAELRLDSDDSLVADFPDWKVIKRTTAWRASNLLHWIDDYGRWIDGTTPRFLWTTYQRFVGANCAPCIDANESTYLNFRGHALGRKLWPDFQASGRNVSLYFSPMSGVNPDTSDQFSPWLDALNTLGLRFWMIVTQYFGEIIGGDGEEDGDEAPSAPSVSCSPTGGSISDAYVYVKISAVGGRTTLYSSRWTVESEASDSDHDGALSGSTNSCVVTMPARSGGEIGYWVYADGVGSESEPSNGDYSLQTTRFVEPGRSVTLTEIIDSQKEPFTVSIADQPGSLKNLRQNSWSSVATASVTDLDIIDMLETLADGDGALLGYYLCDECSAYDIGVMYKQMDWLRTTAPGRINMALPHEVRSFAGVDWFYSPILDVNAQDIYYEDAGDNPETRLMQQSATTTGRLGTCYAFGGRNTTASYANMNLNLVDQWTDDKMRSHDGSRFNAPIVQQWGRDAGSCYGWTLAEMRKQLWKAVIGVQNWGMIGGVGTWGWVSVSGLDRMARIPADLDISGGDPRGNTEALDADIRAGAELMAIEHVLIEPVDDSSQLGFGTVLDGAPTSSISLPTATCGGWSDPIRAVAKQMPNGDQWIFATNLCKDSQTMTFSLADGTGKVATDYFTGAPYTITSGDFSVPSTDFGVHVIKIETPKGGGIRGR